MAALLFHYGIEQPLWRQVGLIQAGPSLADSNCSIRLQKPELSALQQALSSRGLPPYGPLIHYTDPFLMQAAPLRGLRQWQGPRLLACGDLHHGNRPIETLAAYLDAEPHDAVLLTLNTALVAEVRQQLRALVISLPPTFFLYDSAVSVERRRLELLHTDSLNPIQPNFN